MEIKCLLHETGHLFNAVSVKECCLHCLLTEHKPLMPAFPVLAGSDAARLAERTLQPHTQDACGLKGIDKPIGECLATEGLWDHKHVQTGNAHPTFHR